jgi:hypothetical protein
MPVWTKPFIDAQSTVSVKYGVVPLLINKLGIPDARGVMSHVGVADHAVGVPPPGFVPTNIFPVVGIRLYDDAAEATFVFVI